jgi:DNA topoisomerase-2
MATRDYASLSIEDHIRTKDMWAGSTERIDTPMIVFARGTLGATYETVALSPALFKCFDEPLVNALDQAEYSRRAATTTIAPTTEIRIAFDADTGRIEIANNGEGIPIVATPSTHEMLTPTFVFGNVFAGSNTRAAKSSTLGGTNGIGVKITNIHSLEFRVETRDRAHAFSQTWTRGMRDVAPPVVTPATSATREGTRVSFLLDYENFKTAPREFEPIAYTRAVWAALYAEYMLPGVAIYWNGARIHYSREQYERAIFGAKGYTRDASAAAAPPRVEIDDSRANLVIIAAPHAKRFAMSLVNGIIVPTGNHIDAIIAHISDAVKQSIRAQLRARDATAIAGLRAASSHLALIIIWRATGVHWNGQSKDHARFEPAQIRAITPAPALTAALAESMSAAFIARLDRAPRARAPKIDIEKYTPAQAAGTRRSAQCRLFLAEGNSAMSQVELGIARTIGFTLHGVLSLRGVIPNVRKESVASRDAATGAVRYKRSQKLIGNKFMATLAQVLGIDYARRYATAAERATLRYGGIIGCVDQDLDGIGNIFSLVLNLFHLYWPALLECGYVQRLATPIIRAYPRARGKSATARVLEFYSDEEYRAWESHAPHAQTYRVRYYKGLGKHSAAEMQQIMKNLRTQIITYSRDPGADRAFEIYLGDDPALRREQLSQPPPRADPDAELALASRREMAASYHLRREAHTYQLDNLHRKINDIIGGTNQVSRKILDGCIKIFAHTREERKVADLAGTISTTENYHHGEASLQDAIIRRGFIAPGGCQLPMLLPVGHFGSRNAGGQDAAQARYVAAAFNHPVNDVLYQSEDYALLDFHIDEGVRGEPRFFVPIIPTAIVENIEVPAHGWNIRIWGREVMDIIANVRALIVSGGVARPQRMRPCCYPLGPIEALPSPPRWSDECERVIADCTGRAPAPTQFMWRGYIIERAYGERANEIWSLGTYEWIAADKIAITELPLCVWSLPYVREMNKIAESAPSFIRRCDYSPGDDINIQITLDLDLAARIGIASAPAGTRSPARATDPVIVALHLRNKMVDALNFMMPDDSVRTFATYEDVLAYWFPIRAEYYARRIARQRELIATRIAYYENIIRYIHSTRDDTAARHAFRVAQMTTEDAEAALAENKFARIDAAFLESPELKFERAPAARALGATASYAYILNLRERDITLDGCAKFERALEEQRDCLRALDESARPEFGAPFVGARVWLAELDLLTERINRGRATRWQYGDYERYSFE